MSASQPAQQWLVDPRSLRPGRLMPPLSKSDAQRALVLARLTAASELARLPDRPEHLPSDIQVMQRGLDTLWGWKGGWAEVDCADGGAPFRILLGQAAASAGAQVRFRGTPRLGERPHGPLVESLREALGPSGLAIEQGSPWPIEVRAPARSGAPLFRVSASESSQFATSLLLASAALCVRESRPWSVELVGELASTGYLELTLRWLARFGFSVSRTERRLTIERWAPVAHAPAIPGDWSSLGYLLLVGWKSGSLISRVDVEAEHPDRAVVRVLEGVGLSLTPAGPGEVRVEGVLGAGACASGAECPDLLPTVAALACVLPQPSTLEAVDILRHKESDRLEAIEELVAAAGGHTARQGEQLTIVPGQVPDPFRVHSRGDHRVVMSAVTLAVLSGSRLLIDNPGCVAKSFPAFWEALQGVGVSLVPTAIDPDLNPRSR